ncbi:MAG TPA: cupin domain-containing protein [Bryobacteraceae bacterium]|nr:cupin domain-containing protein [Bryobacteraceae bacterium]
MTTNSTQNTSRIRIVGRLRYWKKYGIGLALTVVAAAGLITARTALADPTGLNIVPLAQGFSTQQEIHIQAHGPNDVLQAQLVFQPGGDTGWHTHPGPVVVVVKSGALTEIHKNGCVSVHPAGSVFFESAGEVHRAINQTGAVSEVYATFISPAGAPPLQPAGDPGGTCRERD